jgi:hypothetical protein
LIFVIQILNEKIIKMKIINKLLAGSIFASIVLVGFSSCLKNGPYYTNYAAVAASIDLPLSAPDVVIGFPGNSVITFGYTTSNLTLFDGATGTTTSYIPGTGNNFTFPVYINVASPSVLGTATTATLAIDTAFFNQYNAANGGAFVLMPDSAYTVSSWNLTVAAGSRLDSMQVTFNYSKLDSTVQNYVLPITIVSSSLPIEQWNHLLLNIAD